jgi:hypothetical protein
VPRKEAKRIGPTAGNAMSDWNTTFLQRMRQLRSRPGATERLRVMVRTWFVESIWRQRELEARVAARERIADEQGGDRAEWEAAGISPSDDPPVDLPLPPPRRPVTLTEKYAAIAALHDAASRGVDPVSPFPLRPIDDQPGANRGMLLFALLRREAETLVAGDCSYIEPWLRDVESELNRFLESDATACCSEREAIAPCNLLELLSVLYQDHMDWETRQRRARQQRAALIALERDYPAGISLAIAVLLLRVMTGEIEANSLSPLDANQQTARHVLSCRFHDATVEIHDEKMASLGIPKSDWPQWVLNDTTLWTEAVQFLFRQPEWRTAFDEDDLKSLVGRASLGALNGNEPLLLIVNEMGAAGVANRLLEVLWIKLAADAAKVGLPKPSEQAMDDKSQFADAEWSSTAVDNPRLAVERTSHTRKHNRKRSTERGEGREKLIAALIRHHKYEDGGCLNLEPVGNNELARQAEVDQATASAFFTREFKGHRNYKVVCADAGGLVAALKLLSGEFAPYLLYGRKPANEGERDEE